MENSIYSAFCICFYNCNFSSDIFTIRRRRKTHKIKFTFFIIRNKGVMVCLKLTLLTIMAHYGLYTYIAPLANYFNLYGGIKLASALFGIGTIISVVIAGKVVDTHLGSLLIFNLTLALGAMLIFVVFQGMMFISHIGFLLWGVSFGSLTTIFQAAVTKQVETGKDIATSLQSSTFNFGIVFGSVLGGFILDNYSVFYIGLHRFFQPEFSQKILPTVLL